MATPSKLNSTVRGYTERAFLSEDHKTEIALRTTVQPVSTTEEVIREMVTAGIPMEQILIPGQGKKDVLFLANDFNDLSEEFTQ